MTKKKSVNSSFEITEAAKDETHSLLKAKMRELSKMIDEKIKVLEDEIDIKSDEVHDLRQLQDQLDTVESGTK